MIDRKHSAAAAAAVLMASMLAGPAGACDVPVFRYALERWEPSPYEAIVFHRGELSPEHKKVFAKLRELSGAEEAPCNISAHTIDVDAKMNRYVAAVWEGQKDVELPRMVLCYPLRLGGVAVAWSVPLTPANVEAAVDSPARREVASRIIKGATAVWVLLESGNKAKDDAAAKLIAGELKRLEGLLELPVPLAALVWPGGEPATGGPALKVAFSLLRLPRGNPKERAFEQILLNTEDDLATKFASEPMAFAVFGQGRAMFSLVGKGINKPNIEEVCGFLVGRCSCQVKEMNPGVDLLITANWYAAFEDEEPAVSPLPGVIAANPAASQPAVVEAAAAPGGPGAAAPQASADPAGGGGALVRNLLIALGFVVLVTVVLVLRVGRRARQN